MAPVMTTACNTGGVSRGLTLYTNVIYILPCILQVTLPIDHVIAQFAMAPVMATACNTGWGIELAQSLHM